MKVFSLLIISESKSLFSGQAAYCGVTTQVGSLGLEANHEPMIGILKEGSNINYTDDTGKNSSVIIKNGMFMFKDNTCAITVSLK